jgi:hypothetical protein
MTTSANQPLELLLTLLKADAIKDLAPVAIGALTLIEKTPGALGLAAAKLYVIGNAPAALMQLESDFLGQAVTDIQADLANVVTQGNAQVAAAQATIAAVKTA